MDIVAYSKLTVDEQTRLLGQLQRVVRATSEFRRAQELNQLLRLPTGDGMALVFFGDPDSPAKCAVEISQAVCRESRLPLRMGVHTGPVQRVEDINANRNVAGGGINIAQRVMDAGDAGHILVSSQAADFLATTAWSRSLHDLGEVEVKHGVRVHLYNLYDGDAGNPAIPYKLRSAAKRRRNRTVRYGAAAAALLVVALFIPFGVLHHRRNYAVAHVTGRPAVAVLGFKNLSGRPEVNWISTAVAEMLRTELAAGDKLRTIPGENVIRMKVDLALPDAESLAQDTLKLIYQNLGSDFVVLGSYLDVDGEVRIDLNLQETAKGDLLASIKENGTEQQLIDLVNRAGAELRTHCGVGAVSPEDAAEVRAAIPANPEATRLYAQGIAHLRVFDTVGARDLLQQAVVADAGFAQAHSALATAWSKLGYDGKAVEEARLAFRAAREVSQEDRLAIEANYRELSHENAAAVQILKKLFAAYPDSIDYGLRLVEAQVHAGQPKDGLTTVEALRRLPSPAGSDPRIDLEEATAAYALSDYRGELAAATAAIQKADQHGARLIFARALIIQCVAFRELGRPQEALKACDRGSKIYFSVGDRASAAGGWNAEANVLSDEGDAAGAKQLYERALAVYREIGYERGLAGALDNVASTLDVLGRSSEAQAMSRQALAVYRKIGDEVGQCETLNNIAGRMVLMGDYSSGQKTFFEAIAIAREIGDRGREAVALNNVAEILRDEADLPRSKQTYQQSIAIFEQLGELGKSAYPMIGLSSILYNEGDLYGAEKTFATALQRSKDAGDTGEMALATAGLADISFQKNDLAVARRNYEQALAAQQQNGDVAAIADTRCSLARLLIEQGEASDAIDMAQKALATFQQAARPDGESAARAVLVKALIAAGRSTDARKQIEQGLTQLKRIPNTQLRLEFNLAAAEVDSRRGKPATAITSLQGIVMKASRLGLVPLQLEARLAAAEAQLLAHNITMARSEFRSLNADAQVKGFKRIADQAAAAIKGTR